MSQPLDQLDATIDDYVNGHLDTDDYLNKVDYVRKAQIQAAGKRVVGAGAGAVGASAASIAFPEIAALVGVALIACLVVILFRSQ